MRRPAWFALVTCMADVMAYCLNAADAPPMPGRTAVLADIKGPDGVGGGAAAAAVRRPKATAPPRDGGWKLTLMPAGVLPSGAAVVAAVVAVVVAVVDPATGKPSSRRFAATRSSTLRRKSSTQCMDLAVLFACSMVYGASPQSSTKCSRHSGQGMPTAILAMKFTKWAALLSSKSSWACRATARITYQ